MPIPLLPHKAFPILLYSWEILFFPAGLLHILYDSHTLISSSYFMKSWVLKCRFHFNLFKHITCTLLLLLLKALQLRGSFGLLNEFFPFGPVSDAVSCSLLTLQFAPIILYSSSCIQIATKHRLRTNAAPYHFLSGLFSDVIGVHTVRRRWQTAVYKYEALVPSQ